MPGESNRIGSAPRNRRWSVSFFVHPKSLRIPPVPEHLVFADGPGSTAPSPGSRPTEADTVPQNYQTEDSIAAKGTPLFAKNAIIRLQSMEKFDFDFKRKTMRQAMGPREFLNIAFSCFKLEKL